VRPLDTLTALLVVVIWGGNFIAMRAGALDIPPYFLLGLRLAVASIALAWFLRSPRGIVIPLMLIAFTMTTLHFGLALVGLQYVDAGTGAIAMQTAVPFAALIAWLLFREPLGWRRAAGMVVAFGGIMVLTGVPRIGARLDMLALMMLSAFFFSVATIQIKRLGPQDFMSLNGWISIFGALFAFTVSFAFETGQVEALVDARWPAVVGILYMALLASVFGQGLWYRLLPRYETNQVMPFTLLVPVLGVLFGVLLLDEAPSWRIVFGGIVTVTGVAMIVFRPKTRTIARANTQPEP
jgi:O-acetylserine/cysteine efflux transporter